MPCLGCTIRLRTAGEMLCPRCRAGLAAGPDRLTAGGVLVASAFVHDGAARRLTHALKYGGVAAAASVAVPALMDRLPDGMGAVVPVVRARARRWRYGVDPAVELARAIARHVRVPVLDVLRPRLWYSRRAGTSSGRRSVPSFDVGGPVPAGSVLVDDVVTTGTTIDAAAAALGDVTHAVTFTASSGRTALRRAPVDRYHRS